MRPLPKYVGRRAAARAVSASHYTDLCISLTHSRPDFIHRPSATNIDLPCERRGLLAREVSPAVIKPTKEVKLPHERFRPIRSNLADLGERTRVDRTVAYEIRQSALCGGHQRRDSRRAPPPRMG